jgi:hypothetical protein
MPYQVESQRLQVPRHSLHQADQLCGLSSEVRLGFLQLLLVLVQLISEHHELLGNDALHCQVGEVSFMLTHLLLLLIQPDPLPR